MASARWPGDFRSATLKRLLLLAYDVKNHQVSGPGWLDTERYDIAAKVPAGSTKNTPSTEPNGPHAQTMAKAQTLSALTQILGSQIGRPVFDKTGLTGKYDFDLEFTPDLRGMPPPPGAPPADNASDPGPNLASAVQQQLGLRLVSSKAKIDVLVIDKAEKVPTAGGAGYNPAPLTERSTFARP